jgi:hypothetical protein
MKSYYETGRSETREQMTTGYAAMILAGLAPIGSKLWFEARAVFARSRANNKIEDARWDGYAEGARDQRLATAEDRRIAMARS